MKSVAVGATLPQFTDDRDRLLRAVKAAERAGLDSIWLFDHRWPLSGGKERPVLDGWTTFAWLAAATERITVGSLVARTSIQVPALMATMSATLGAIAPGRLIVGLGSGDDASRAENEAFGLPYYASDERVDQLRGSVLTVRDHLRKHASPPPLWVGGRADTVLEIAGTLADGWNAWGGSPERFTQDAQQTLVYAGERSVELSWGGISVLADTDEAARSVLGDKPVGDRVVGSPSTVADRLNEYVQAGARHLVLTPFGSTGDERFYELAADVKEKLNSL